MKIRILVSIFSFFVLSVSVATAQRNKEIYVKNWHVVPPVGLADSIPPDTLSVNFQDANPIDRYSIANSFNGNLGSPIQSKIYFDRTQNSSFIFGDVYVPYITKPENITFYNTKTPFSSIYATGGGTTYRAENQVNFLFAANANKRLNFGTNINFINAVGEYLNQTSKRFTADLFGSYDGEKYSASGAIIYNKLSNYENGGISQPDQLHNFSAKDMAVNLTNGAISGYAYSAFVYNHSYSLGFNRTVQVSEDSTRIDFIPVTRFAHTLKVSDERKRYAENYSDTAFYVNTYYSNTTTRDTAAFTNISNTFSVSIEEEFNKWMKFGLKAYISNDIQTYTVMQDSSSLNKVHRTRTKIGGVLSREQSQRFRYNINAELDVLGTQIGDFNVEGVIGGFFNLWNDSIALIARGFVRNESPSFFQERYRSNHFRWDRDFNNIFRTHVGGTFSVPTRKLSLDVRLENISNYIYFDNRAYPQQDNGNIQIFAIDLKKDFRAWRFYLENHLVYQASSNQDKLPLPDLTLHHNLYYLDTWAKGVLTVQLGVDVRYHTSYYAPSYMPATGQFIVQNEEKIGNYPVMNVYANFHLKTVRFFLKAYHINELFMDRDYYSMPNYPINPFVLKVGLSWNFYN